jgi:hypothetical protein
MRINISGGIFKKGGNISCSKTRQDSKASVIKMAEKAHVTLNFKII